MNRFPDLASRLRLITGLTMFAFVTTHLLNHALGLVSLDAMLAAQRVFLAVWTRMPGAAVLLLALLTHLALVSAKQVRRRTWRIPMVEAVRIVLGVIVLLLLTSHVLGNYVLFRIPGARDTYLPFLLGFTPDKVIRQTVLVAAAWGHGCIGVHRWLRFRPGYRRLLPILYPAAVLLPVLALLGIFVADREVQRLALDPAWRAALAAGLPKPRPEWTALLMPWWKTALTVTGCVVGTVLAANAALRLWNLRRHGTVHIQYPLGRTVSVVPGTTVLEASAIGRLPHASVCGGRGRCSTCRVQVLAGLRTLPAPDAAEQRVLKRIGAPGNVRLACQLRPREDLSVVPLVPYTAGPEPARRQGRFLFGQELEIAILFSDVRGFTRLSERKLAYDVVHLLNQYFETMSEAIMANGGYVDKFIGDGIMALFGLQDGPEAGCRGALAAAKAMAERLEELNWRLAQDLPEPLRIGIGIHVGTVIVGEMGNAAASAVTAIGDPVNVASRLEGLTKKTQGQLVVAADVARLAGVNLAGFPRYRVTVRGRNEPLSIYAVPSALELPEAGALSAAAAVPKHPPLSAAAAS
jgi:adenylate cyclase